MNTTKEEREEKLWREVIVAVVNAIPTGSLEELLKSLQAKYVIGNEEQVTISRKEHDVLLERDEWLSALEEAGVDNWQGYDDAREYMKASQDAVTEDLSDD